MKTNHVATLFIFFTIFIFSCVNDSVSETDKATTDLTPPDTLESELQLYTNYLVKELDVSKDTYHSIAKTLLEGYEKPYVLELESKNVSGSYSPQELYSPKAWGYNVIKINNTSEANFSFTLKGNEEGSKEDAAHFKAQVVIKNSDGSYKFEEIDTDDALNSNISFEATSADTEIFLVVAAVPEVF